MLLFRSEVFPEFFPEQLDYKTKTMFVGSCFTEHIGNKMLNLKFPTIINPFGILYNPVSVARSIERILNPVLFGEKDLLFFNEKWISFMHHGRFSSMNSGDALDLINNHLTESSKYFHEKLVLFITFGTAWVYKYKKSNQVVANCHKIPASEFERIQLSVNEIVERYSSLLENIKKKNKDIKIVFTVSPVRHWKDGPVDNQYSKSILIVAVNELTRMFDSASYFPSYEIMMDDLRDYRFYDDDLFHPNQMAIEYIWEKFAECFIKSEAIDISKKIEKIRKAALHRPFYQKTKAYKNFIESNLLEIKRLQRLYPELDFSEELNHFMLEKEK